MVCNHTTGWLCPGMASFKGKGIHRQCYKSNENNPETAFSNFFETFNSARDICFPGVKTQSRPIEFKHSPWMSNSLKISQKQEGK